MGYILAINSGSSSIKFAIIQVSKLDKEVLKGKFDQDNLTLTLQKTEEEAKSLSFASSEEAMIYLVKTLGQEYPIIAIGHRVVHGGLKFTQAIKIDEEVIKEITALGPLAPLHQYPALKYIELFRQSFRHINQYAYFDTAFHATIPKLHRMFALPYKFYQDGVMKYGFHGIACESVLHNMSHLCELSQYRKIIIAHLGNGCSMTSVKDGKSFETSMGFTALDGLMMGTRCGRIDPGVILHLMEHYRMSAKEIEVLLYKESGIKGTSGISNDMRQLEETDNHQAKEAIDLFCHIAVGEMMRLIGSMQGVQAIVFSGGIGENSAQIRKSILQKLDFLGIELDHQINQNLGHNKALQAKEGKITSKSSKIDSYVIGVNEELVIARKIQELIQVG